MEMKRAMGVCMLSMMVMALAGFGAVNAQSILDVAQSNDSFSTLVSVIQAAEQPDLITAIGDAETVATVFAPTNDAFEELSDTLGVSLETLLELPPSTLASIVLYHVVPGAYDAGDTN